MSLHWGTKVLEGMAAAVIAVGVFTRHMDIAFYPALALVVAGLVVNLIWGREDRRADASWGPGEARRARQRRDDSDETSRQGMYVAEPNGSYGYAPNMEAFRDDRHH